MALQRVTINSAIDVIFTRCSVHSFSRQFSKVKHSSDETDDDQLNGELFCSLRHLAAEARSPREVR